MVIVLREYADLAVMLTKVQDARITQLLILQLQLKLASYQIAHALQHLKHQHAQEKAAAQFQTVVVEHGAAEHVHLLIHAVVVALQMSAVAHLQPVLHKEKIVVPYLTDAEEL